MEVNRSPHICLLNTRYNARAAESARRIGVLSNNIMYAATHIFVYDSAHTHTHVCALVHSIMVAADPILT